MIEQHRIVDSDDPGFTTNVESYTVNSLLVSLGINEHCLDEVWELGD